MLKNCNYDKIRLLHDLSRIAWYLEKHAKEDAKNGSHDWCSDIYEELRLDLEKHIGKLKQAVEGLSKEGKFH